MSDSRVLVVGATGLLGSAIARKLCDNGVPVRALGRSQERLNALRLPGAELVAVDMLDQQKLTEACRGVTQIVATATNNMGKGDRSPLKVDLTAYQNLCAAARNTGVKRLVYVSFRGVTPDEPVDIFRLKWHIQDVVRRSQVPYVIVSPSALTDIWVNEVIGGGLRKNGVAVIFGDGNRPQNYVAVDDVAEYAVKILARPEIVNEVIEIGGPSDLTLNEVAGLIERRLGTSGKRKHIPMFAMRFLPPIVRPFNEVAARLMTMGYYVATRSTPFPQWKKAADRLGVTPGTVEEFVQRMSKT